MINVPDVIAPALTAAGFTRTDDDSFERGGDGAEVFRNGGHWWIVIIINRELVSESRVDSITQVLRILWAYGLVSWNWAATEIDHCDPDAGVHSTPHKGCILR